MYMRFPFLKKFNQWTMIHPIWYIYFIVNLHLKFYFAHVKCCLLTRLPFFPPTLPFPFSFNGEALCWKQGGNCLSCPFSSISCYVKVLLPMEDTFIYRKDLLPFTCRPCTIQLKNLLYFKLRNNPVTLR